MIQRLEREPAAQLLRCGPRLPPVIDDGVFASVSLVSGRVSCVESNHPYNLLFTTDFLSSPPIIYTAVVHGLQRCPAPFKNVLPPEPGFCYNLCFRHGNNICTADDTANQTAWASIMVDLAHSGNGFYKGCNSAQTDSNIGTTNAAYAAAVSS